MRLSARARQYREFWSRPVAIVLLVGSLLAAIGTIYAIISNFIPPVINADFRDGSALRFGQPLELDTQDIDPLTRRVRLVMVLVAENKEWWPLTVSGTEIAVDDSIRLRSQARMKLAPGKAVREHEGARLEASTTWLPITKPDTLVLPLEIEMFGWLLLDNITKVPVVIPVRVAARQQHLLDAAKVDVEATIYFEHRPKHVVRTRFTVPPFMESPWPNGRALVTPSNTDRQRFLALSGGRGENAAQWVEQYPPTGDTVSYRRCFLEGGAYQAFSVNRVLRAVAADTNADSILDFELLDVDGDGRVDHRALTRGVSRRAIRWGPEIVRINSADHARGLQAIARRIGLLAP